MLLYSKITKTSPNASNNKKPRNSMNLEIKIDVGVNRKITLVTVGMVVGGKRSCNLLRSPILFASIIGCNLCIYAGWLHLMLIDFKIESTRIKTSHASTKRKIFNKPRS